MYAACCIDLSTATLSTHTMRSSAFIVVFLCAFAVVWAAEPSATASQESATPNLESYMTLHIKTLAQVVAFPQDYQMERAECQPLTSYTEVNLLELYDGREGRQAVIRDRLNKRLEAAQARAKALNCEKESSEMWSSWQALMQVLSSASQKVSQAQSGAPAPAAAKTSRATKQSQEEEEELKV